MEPYYEDRHYTLAKEVRRFALEAVAPVARELDRRSEFPWENVKSMADRGWLGVPVPTEYGGMGLDTLSYLIVIQELARVDASHAITVSAHTTLGTLPILMFGSEKQKRSFVPLLARGEVLGGFGLTEPGSGSDASALRTRAEQEGDGWRIRGSKLFITHSGVGEIFNVTAVTDPDRGTAGISAFVLTKPTVEPGRARAVGMGTAEPLGFVGGVRSGRKEDKMGWRASDTRELLLDDARVPEGRLLGRRGEGFHYFMRILDAGRVGMAALSVGLAQGAIDAVLEYTRREGGPVAGESRQSSRFRIAELGTALQAARHLTYHAAWLMERGRPFRREAAMAKLHASELSMEAAARAVQIVGTAGYTDEHPVERMFRDAKVSEIGEGTSEIQKIVIARGLVDEAFDEHRSSRSRSGE